jgi:hypothetical protein
LWAISKPSFADQGEQSEYMTARIPVQKALAFATAIDVPPDTHVIQDSQPEPMNLEASTADLTRDLAEYIVA